MLLLQDGLAFFFVIKAYFEKSISLGDVSSSPSIGNSATT
jgi:hypothetical protein